MAESDTTTMREQVLLASYAIIVFGVLLLLASLFADPLALGEPGTSFGWKQMLGAALGIVIAVGGYLLMRRMERSGTRD